MFHFVAVRLVCGSGGRPLGLGKLDRALEVLHGRADGVLVLGLIGRVGELLSLGACKMNLLRFCVALNLIDSLLVSHSVLLQQHHQLVRTQSLEWTAMNLIGGSRETLLIDGGTRRRSDLLAVTPQSRHMLDTVLDLLQLLSIVVVHAIQCNYLVTRHADIKQETLVLQTLGMQRMSVLLQTVLQHTGTERQVVLLVHGVEHAHIDFFRELGAIGLVLVFGEPTVGELQHRFNAWIVLKPQSVFSKLLQLLAELTMELLGEHRDL